MKVLKARFGALEESEQPFDEQRDSECVKRFLRILAIGAFVILLATGHIYALHRFTDTACWVLVILFCLPIDIWPTKR